MVNEPTSAVSVGFVLSTRLPVPGSSVDCDGVAGGTGVELQEPGRHRTAQDGTQLGDRSSKGLCKSFITGKG